MDDKEYSFEDFFASGTGIESEKTEAMSISSEKFDGYIDGISMEMYSINEDIEFLNSYEAVSEMNTNEKIKMLKKIKANYNHQSIESYCDNKIQSLESSNDETKEKKSFGAKIKDVFIAIFKKIREIVEKIIEKLTIMRFKGQTADLIKSTLKIISVGTKKYEDEIIKFDSKYSKYYLEGFSNSLKNNGKSDEEIESIVKGLNDNIKTVTKIYSNNRKALIDFVKIYSLANKIVQFKTKKVSITIDTDALERTNIYKGDIFTNVKRSADTINKLAVYLEKNVKMFSMSDIDKQLDNALKSHLKNSEEQAKLTGLLLDKITKEFEEMKSAERPKEETK